MKRHFRFVIFCILFAVAPASLFIYVVEAVLSYRDASKIAGKTHELAEILSRIKDEYVLEQEKTRIAREIIRKLRNLPVLDEKSVCEVRKDADAKWPGLLKIIVTGEKGSLTGKNELKYSFIYEAFARYLVERANNPGLPSDSRLHKLFKKIIGDGIEAKKIADASGSFFEIENEGRSADIYWDTLKKGPDNISVCHPVAVLIFYKDVSKNLFSLENTVLSVLPELAAKNITAGLISFSEPSSVRPLIEKDRELEVFLKSPVKYGLDVLTSRGIYTFLPVRGPGRKVLWASTERHILLKSRKLVMIVAHILAISFIAGTIFVLALFYYRRIRLFLSVKWQLLGIFTIFTLVPLAGITFMGMQYLRSNEEFIARRVIESIKKQISSIEEARRNVDEALINVGKSVEESREIRMMDVPAIYWLFEKLIKETFISGYILFNSDGKAVLQTSDVLGTYQYELLCKIVETMLRHIKYGFSPPSREVKARLEAGELEALFENEEIAEEIYRALGSVFDAGVVGIDSSFFLGVARGYELEKIHGVFVLGFKTKKINLEVLGNSIRSNHALGNNPVKMFGASVNNDSVRLPSREHFSPRIERMVRETARMKQYGPEIIELDGEKTIACGKILENMKDYAVIALCPYSVVLDEHRNSRKLLAILLALSFLIVVSIGTIVTMKLLIPIGIFEKGMRAIMSGDFEKAFLIDSSDELGMISRTFERMRKGLIEKRRMSIYVSDHVRARVRREAGTGEKRLGEEKKASILFSDLRRFTTLSELYPPSEIVSMLNEYFERMTACIRRYDGTVDRFIGDAVLAAFFELPGRAPVETRAVLAALEMNSEIKKFNAEREKKGLFTVEAGMGISTGFVIVGPVGSEKYRADIAMVGQTATEAAALEELSKKGNFSRVVISQGVMQATHHLIDAVSLNEGNAFEIRGMKQMEEYFSFLESRHAEKRCEGIRLIGLLGEDAAVEKLIPLLYDPDGAVRREAAMTLKNFRKRDEIQENILQALEREKDPRVRATMIVALGHMASEEIVLKLLKYLDDDDARVRANTIETIRELKNRENIIPVLRERLEDPNNRIRANAAVVLWYFGEESALDTLIRMTTSDSHLMRASAAWALGEIAARKTMESLGMAGTGETLSLRDIKRFDEIMVILNNMLFDGHEMVVRNAVIALGKMGNRSATEGLLELYKRTDSVEIKRFVLQALEETGAFSLIGALRKGRRES